MVFSATRVSRVHCRDVSSGNIIRGTATGKPRDSLGNAFESAVTRAHELYDPLPAEVHLRLFRHIRTALFGIVEEEVSLRGIAQTYRDRTRTVEYSSE